MSSHAASTRLQDLALTLRHPAVGRVIARTAGFNIASTIAAGLGGVILARALGPTLRGEYAAVTAWFGVTLLVGGMGQPAALCFYVAHDPHHGREYVATSRLMMLTTGTCALIGGMLLTPLLAHGALRLEDSYRLAFAISIVSFLGASYTASLQAQDLFRWNRVRLSQPVVALISIVLLWRLRLLSLNIALVILALTMLLQLGWAYANCRRVGLAPGKSRVELIRPLTKYGVAQIAAATPAALNAQLDQLVLSQTVPSAELGRYAVAVSLTLLPIPLVSSIGNVAFPRLAARSAFTPATRRMQRFAILGSAALAIGMLVPLAVASYWLVPFVFGERYSGAVPLLWILTPGAVFLACGQVVGDLLRGRNRPIVVGWAQGFAAVFTVGLLVVLLPAVGIYGAAIASTVAYGIALAAMVYCLRRMSDNPSPASGPKHSRLRTFDIFLNSSNRMRGK